MSSTEEKLAELRALWLRRRADEFDMVLGNVDATYAESPIERLFLAACLVEGWRRTEGSDARPAIDAMWDLGVNVQEDWTGGIFVLRGNAQIALVSQLPLKLGERCVRLDFAALLLSTGDRFAIELDGHDFHDRTKEQAERDKSRDRLLTEKGWSPIRFTGSEVWRDPSACAQQVRTLLVSAMSRFSARQEQP